MSLLHNGDAFPKLQVPAVGGGTMSLPGDLAGAYGVVLIYRGAWCPVCVEQLLGYVAEKDALDALGVKVVALSVDDEATGAGLATKLALPFPVGHGADAGTVAAATGAFTNDRPPYLQPTAFVLSPDGAVMAAVYATNAVGRLSATHVAQFVGFMKSKVAAKAEAAE
jgi:peroxiredoxin